MTTHLCPPCLSAAQSPSLLGCHAKTSTSQAPPAKPRSTTHHPGTQICSVHEQHKPPSDPAPAAKGKSKAQKGREESLAGLHHNTSNLLRAWPIRLIQRHQKLARPPRKFHLGSFAACPPSLPTSTTKPPLHPTGSRVAAESHFDTTSPWARHSLSLLSRRYVLSFPAPGNASLGACRVRRCPARVARRSCSAAPPRDPRCSHASLLGGFTLKPVLHLHRCLQRSASDVVLQGLHSVLQIILGSEWLLTESASVLDISEWRR